MNTGKRVWEFPWFSDPVVESNNGSLGNTAARRIDNLRTRLIENAISGHLASDGETLYLIDDSESQPGIEDIDPFMLRGIGRTRFAARSHNVLVALDLSKEGKYRWRIGGSTGEQEPELADAFFLGPPLVVGEDLFVIAERNSDISVYSLDQSTGKVLWSQQLGQIDQMGQFFPNNDDSSVPYRRIRMEFSFVRRQREPWSPWMLKSDRSCGDTNIETTCRS